MNERPSGRDESEAERLDRNLGELLQELRVALPGVQVLCAVLPLKRRLRYRGEGLPMIDPPAGG